MANPFLGEQHVHTPSHVTDTFGDDLYFGSTHFTVAGFLLVSLVVLVAMHMSGFKAMVGIGRG